MGKEWGSTATTTQLIHHLEQEACMYRDTRQRWGVSILCAQQTTMSTDRTASPEHVRTLGPRKKEPTTPTYWPKRRKGQTCIDGFEKGFEKEQLNFE